VHNSVVRILTGGGQTKEHAERIADVLASGQFTHDYAIDPAEARAMGLSVRDELLRDVYVLMDLSPQPARSTAVYYIPEPYRREPPMSAHPIPRTAAKH